MSSKDCFMVLEYIRSSIEIIMSLKIDDLEGHNSAVVSKRKLSSSAANSDKADKPHAGTHKLGGAESQKGGGA